MPINYTVDLSPSAIAARFLTPEATSVDREIIEAMAERAAAVIVARASLIGTQLAIDNVMISAAETLIKQHRIRMQRLFDVLKAWQDEPDKPDESDTEGKQHESE